MNPYEHVRPVHRAKAADVNKHYAVGRWLLASAEAKDLRQAVIALRLAGNLAVEERARLAELDSEIETYGKMAEEFGVNINDLRRLISW